MDFVPAWRLRAVAGLSSAGVSAAAHACRHNKGVYRAGSLWNGFAGNIMCARTEWSKYHG